jgi:hypothetical protein
LPAVKAAQRTDVEYTSQLIMNQLFDHYRWLCSQTVFGWTTSSLLPVDYMSRIMASKFKFAYPRLLSHICCTELTNFWTFPELCPSSADKTLHQPEWLERCDLSGSCGYVSSGFSRPAESRSWRQHRQLGRCLGFLNHAPEQLMHSLRLPWLLNFCWSF